MNSNCVHKWRKALKDEWKIFWLHWRRYYNITSSFKSNSSQYDSVDKTCGTVYVIIVDRAIDVLTPLLHDFYYQPMVYDLLDINHNMYEYE